MSVLVIAAHDNSKLKTFSLNGLSSYIIALLNSVNFRSSYIWSSILFAPPKKSTTKGFSCLLFPKFAKIGFASGLILFALL